MNELVIDVSHWDGNINLQDWKNRRGLWGVIIKAGGNETGLGRYTDSQFENNYRKAIAAGLHIGAYYYTVTTDINNARQDAEHFAGLLAGKNFDMPCYMDVEDPRQFQLSARALTDVIKTFCNTLRDKGYYAGLYTGGSAWLNNMYSSELNDYANWIAWWRANWPTEAGDIGMWQQGSMNLNTGAVAYDDVSGNVDCNWCIIDYPSRINGGQSGGGSSSGGDTVANGTADDVIRIAEGELGYYAPNDPERGSKYGRWMAQITGEDWMAGPSSEIWWCCMFVSWVLNQAGVKVPGFPSQNTDLALNGGARNLCVDKSQMRRGDILIFDWNWATAATDHIGFAKQSPSGGYVATIEGNVGNAVQNKTRSLDSIRYVVRPQYNGTTPSPTPSTPKNNRDGGKLDVDGSGGYNTVLDWQDQLGTPCDGEISGQYYPNHQYFPGIVTVTWEGYGSTLVQAIQRKVGAGADGIWGRETSQKIQTWLINNGYDCGPGGVDGYFGTDSVKALQRSLNDKKWK